jgi:hypothetical protein
MNNFLSRLIARTTGAAPTVKPLIRPSTVIGLTPTNEYTVDSYQPDVLSAKTESAELPLFRNEASTQIVGTESVEKHLEPPGEYPGIGNRPKQPAPPYPETRMKSVVRESVSSRRKGHEIAGESQSKESVSTTVSDTGNIEKRSDISNPHSTQSPVCGEKYDQGRENREVVASQLSSSQNPEQRKAGDIPPAIKNAGDSSPVQIEPGTAPHITHRIEQVSINIPFPENSYSDNTPVEPLTKTEVPVQTRTTKMAPLVTRHDHGDSSFRKWERPLLEQRQKSPLPSEHSPVPPNIHVTIGRVEVRALPPQTPETQPSAPRRKEHLLSLGEYLKGRSEGNR